MREILFRGQTRKLGEKVYMTGEKVPGNWVYGGIFQGKGCYSVMYGCPDADDITGATLEKHVVYTDTVGQFTGLTDKNGTKIFEGDVVRYSVIIMHTVVHEQIVKITFKKGSFCMEEMNGVSHPLFHNTDNTCLEVIGNIHDNPELIGGADNV